MPKRMLALITRDDDGETVITVQPQETDLSTLQNLVGGYIERVSIPGLPTAHAYVNEDGLLKHLPVNPAASRLAGQSIVGPMIVLGNGPQGTEGDVPEEIYALLKAVGVG